FASYGGFSRMLVYVTSTMMAASILALIPESDMSITKLGTRTLYVYLLHGFFIQLFRELDLFQTNNIFILICIFFLSALIVLALSSKVSLTIGQPLVEGSTSKMKKWRQRKQMDDKEISA